MTPDGEKTPNGASTPLPTDSVPFEFTCQCLNLRVEGRVPSEHSIPDHAGPSTRHQVWLGDYAESGTYPVYWTWKQDDLGAESHQRWRVCTICDTRCYFYASEGRWATIDLSTGIRWGPDLAQMDDSQLSLSLPASSTFGRPPSTNFPTLYPPSDDSQPLVPPVQDPFFLPPPFIPSHPHLRSLCENAVGRLRRRHDELDTQVKEFIATKSREMRDAEEKVRAEVEYLWERYKSGPGEDEDLEPKKPERPAIGERKRSRTINGAIESSLSSTVPTDSPNPIMMEAARLQPNSLLAQSLSANAYTAPPAPVANSVDDSLAAASKSYAKGSDARAVAMSHVFSVLDEAMGSRATGRVSMSLDDAYVETEYDEAVNEEIIKDSWIDDESADCDDEDVPELETQGTTPRPNAQDQSRDRPSKGKEKAVKFEEPAVAKAEYSLDEEAINDAEEDGDGEEEYVFDFEVDEATPAADPDDLVSATPPQPPRTFSRTRNMVEANLSRTFAADAPSHRSAWKRHLEKGTSMLESIRREDPTDDTEVISQLATSMPMAIALKRRTGEMPPMEAKTSLNDRQGKLVPPLRTAMRTSNALGLSPSRSRGARRSSKTIRSASASRERESFKQDPGAVFESLADGDVDENEEEGTLRETFMPPHEVIKREEDRQPDVGWRSMAS